VTGVQTCALPISLLLSARWSANSALCCNDKKKKGKKRGEKKKKENSSSLLFTNICKCLTPSFNDFEKRVDTQWSRVE
jgi:hypothetical protein